MDKKKILLIGPMPPPSGGVSVHLDRLMRKANNHPKLILSVFDPGKFKLYNENGTTGNIISAIKFFLSSKIIHIHISHPAKKTIARISKFFGKKVFYTIHNMRKLQSKSIRSMINISDKIIFVIDPGEIPFNGIVIPAYITPDDHHNLPSELEEVVKKYNRVIVSVSSFSGKLNFSEDIYGFDLILDAVSKTFFPEKSILILVDSNGILKNRYEKAISAIEIKPGLKIIFISSEINFSRLLSQADIFIRATRSDGDALSVREGLNAGITVLASDCIYRPEGCILFKSGDSNDLSKRLMETLTNRGQRVFPQPDFAGKIFELYLME